MSTNVLIRAVDESLDNNIHLNNQRITPESSQRSKTILSPHLKKKFLFLKKNKFEVIFLLYPLLSRISQACL